MAPANPAPTGGREHARLEATWPPAAPSPLSGVLNGLKVVELSYGIAAPVAARYLAVLGADVVRVESRRRPDGLRQGGSAWVPPEVPREARLDTHPLFETTTPGKRSAVLELDTAGGRQAMERVLAAADVFITNLAPGPLAHLGLAPRALCERHPRLICVAISTFGDGGAGEFRDYRTWGHNVAAFCGLSMITGFPEDGPLMLPVSFTDYLGAFAGAACALAAIARRKRTGAGGAVELAIHELAAADLADDVERYLNGGEGLRQQGNDDERSLCQDVFALRGDDRWLALTVRDETDLAALRAVFPGLPGASAGREAVRDELAAVLGALSPDEAMEHMGDLAVPLEVVATMESLGADARLQRDGFWQLRPHRRLGLDLVQALPLIADGVRVADHRSFPALGEHTEEVLLELGFGPDEIVQMASAGEVGPLPYPELQFGPRPWLRQPKPPLGLGERS